MKAIPEVSDLDDFLSLPKHNTTNIACSLVLEYNYLHQNHFGYDNFSKHVIKSIKNTMKMTIFLNKKEI